MELVALTVWAARSWPMHSYRSPLYCLFFFLTCWLLWWFINSFTVG